MIKKISEMIGKKAEKLIDFQFKIGDPVKIYTPYMPKYHKKEGVICDIYPNEVRVKIMRSGDIISFGKEAVPAAIEPLEIYWFHQGEKVEATIPDNPEWQKVKAVITSLDPYNCVVQKEDSNEIMLIHAESMQRFLRPLPLKEEELMTNKKPTWKEACQLIATMFNELEWNDKKDWTAEEVFKTSPTGSRFHMAEYYPIAKAYFQMDPEERIKIKNHPVTKNGKFEFTVPETWKNYKLNKQQIEDLISLADHYKDKPATETKKLVFDIPIGNSEYQSHNFDEFMALVNYLKGDLPDEAKKEEVPKPKKVDYQEVTECPNPYVGLEWTEQYSYYGKVVAKVNRTMAFDWQEKSREWRQALEETYYVIEDTSEKAPYILTADQFKKKFSYNDDGKKCWVRFKLNPAEG